MLEIFAGMFKTLAPVSVETSVVGNGKTVLLDVQACPLVRDGAMVVLYGFARDVTEARRTERDRGELTRSLQLLLASTVEGILLDGATKGRCTMIQRRRHTHARPSSGRVHRTEHA